MTSKRERKLQKKTERKEQASEQRAKHGKRQRNKKIINYAALVIVVAALTYFLWPESEGPGEYDELAQCLTSQGTIMYGTDWCPHCQAQKQSFGNSFRYVTYVNCDLNRAACDLAGVTGYPTWVFGDGSSTSGTQPLDALAERAGCTDAA